MATLSSILAAPKTVVALTATAVVGVPVAIVAVGELGDSSSSTSLSAASNANESDSESALVRRVVDGDTIDVSYGGAKHRVRLLNVNTPETVHPKKSPECLGPEATKFLRRNLPEGTPVHLRFDVEKHDRFDRELAGVFVGKVLINAEIARAGLGGAVLYEPNDRFYARVLAAQEEAEKQQAGLYSRAKKCTLPARVSELERDADAITSAAPPHPGANLDAIDQYAAKLTATLAAGKALAAVVRDPSLSFPEGTYREGLRDDLARQVDSTRTKLKRASEQSASARNRKVARIKAERKKSERAAREAAEERARQEAADVAAEAEERAARAAEREAAREVAEESARRTTRDTEQRPRETSRPRPPSPPEPESESGGADNYTGCRAYGPNGTSIDSKGRTYTKISC